MNGTVLRKLALSVSGFSLLIRLYVSVTTGLSDDEAYYYVWAMRPEWSYYDHPGMTAWLIWLSTSVFGSTALGVRFFAVICSIGTGFFIWKLARDLFSESVAWLALIIYLVAPIFAIGGFMMVPDAPLGCAWTALALVSWRLFEHEKSAKSFWLIAGVLIGVGCLSKYTMVLLPTSLVLAFLFDRDARKRLLAPHFGAAIGIAALFGLPILLWNIQNDWLSFRFHLSDRQTGGFNFNRWIQYWASQAVALGPGLLVTALMTWIISVIRWRDRRWRYLFFVSAPTFALFTWQALMAEFKPHWTAPAYTLISIGVAAWLIESRRRLFVGLAVILLIAPLDLFVAAEMKIALLPKIARSLGYNEKWNPGFDPTNDLYGWVELVDHLKPLRETFKNETQKRVFLASSRYQLVSQLMFAAGEDVFRVSPGRDQFGLWQTKEVEERLRGQNAIFIADNRFERDPRTDGTFERCNEAPPFSFYRNGERAHTFTIWLCENFRAFP